MPFLLLSCLFQFSSVTHLCPTLCDPMECRTPGFPGYLQPPKRGQTSVHWVSDAIQPSHRLSSPSPPTLNLSQHWGLFHWVSSSHQVAKILELQLTSPSNEYLGLISFRINWFDLLAVKGLSRVFSSTTIWKHQFFGSQPSLWSNSHICTWVLEKL